MVTSNAKDDVLAEVDDDDDDDASPSAFFVLANFQPMLTGPRQWWPSKIPRDAFASSSVSTLCTFAETNRNRYAD
jgi:hypothetical protein